MTRQQKIILFSAVGVFLALAALIVVLIVRNSNATKAADEQAAQVERMRQEQVDMEDALVTALSNEFNSLNNEMLENKQIVFENDSLLQQYEASQQRVKQLLEELNREKKDNKNLRQKVKELQAEVETLRRIAKDYAAKWVDAEKRYEEASSQLATTSQRAKDQEAQIQQITQKNENLTQQVTQAKKLEITGLSLETLGKQDKKERKLKNVRKFGVHFTVTPNNMAEPGMKQFYIRIISPDDVLIGNGGSFSAGGSELQASASRSVEYENQEVSTTIYCPVSETLGAGDYRVEVYVDGYRVGSKSFSLK